MSFEDDDDDDQQQQQQRQDDEPDDDDDDDDDDQRRQQYESSHHHHYTTAADAAFLEQRGDSGVDAATATAAAMQQAVVSNSSCSSHTTTTQQQQHHHHLQELHQSNLLRLQTNELLQESRLLLTVPAELDHGGGGIGGGRGAAKVVKWAPFAHEYMQHVSNIIQQDVSLEKLDGGMTLEKNQKNNYKKLDANNVSAVMVDTPARLTVAVNTNNNNGINNNSLLGLTTPTGNAQVLPTLAMQVQIPNKVFTENNNKNNNNSSKDYLRHRYFQV
jgi:hypothetical protein